MVINPKFLIIPLNLIVLGGINNSIQAMDGNYGKENPVDVNNNNNVVNTNKLKEEIQFSDFKDFAQSLAYYYSSADENNKKKEFYRKCTDFIKLLPQFIQNYTNGVTSYETFKKSHINNGMISYEMCLHCLLDFRCFTTMLDISSCDAEFAYKHFLNILKCYSKNFNENEYKKILEMMLNNCLDCILKSNYYFSSKFNLYSFNEMFREAYEDHCSYWLMKRDVMHILIGELAKIEYNNNPSMLMPVSTISDKIMNNLIMPYIKKEIYKLLDSYYKKELSELEEKIFDFKKFNRQDDYTESESESLIEYYEDLPDFFEEATGELDVSLNSKEFINYIKMKLDVNYIVHKATKELRKEELFNTFSKKAKLKIKSEYLVKKINDLTKDNRVIKLLTRYKLPVVKQKVNENNESKEVNINNESENK